MERHTILDILLKQADYTFCLHFEGYAEPGCVDPESGLIATGNWNSTTRYKEKPQKADLLMPRIAAILKKLGVELEWSDEWTECGECNKLVRTQPDSYDWIPSYWTDEQGGCGIVCQECVLEDPEDYLKWLESNPKAANTLDLDLGEAGYFQVNEESYENGLYGGQSDNPEKIAESLKEQGIERFVFNLDRAGQFDVSFSVWVHESEKSKLDPADIVSNGPDPAVAMRSALKDASAKMGQLQGEGVRVTKCHPDGTATAKLVSRQDFIDGKALDG